MNSAIYIGRVKHHRRLPKKHLFDYKVYLNWLDLDEVKEIFKYPPILGRKQFPSIICFNRKKYLSSDIDNLKEAVLDKVENHLGFKPNGKVFILTTLQYFGFCFNPVSFYYAYDEQKQLCAIAAEINNTPWDERFTYCLDMRQKNTHQFDKKFHVSPFMPMEMNYQWFFNKPAKTLSIHMQNFAEGELQFDATVKLKRKAFSFKSLIAYSFLYPLIPVKIVLGIYYHAFMLWLKKTPFHSHPKTIKNKEEFSHE